MDYFSPIYPRKPYLRRDSGDFGGNILAMLSNDQSANKDQ